MAFYLFDLSIRHVDKYIQFTLARSKQNVYYIFRVNQIGYVVEKNLKTKRNPTHCLKDGLETKEILTSKINSF